MAFKNLPSSSHQPFPWVEGVYEILQDLVRLDVGGISIAQSKSKSRDYDSMLVAGRKFEVQNPKSRRIADCASAADTADASLRLVAAHACICATRKAKKVPCTCTRIGNVWAVSARPLRGSGDGAAKAKEDVRNRRVYSTDLETKSVEETLLKTEGKYIVGPHY